MSVDELFGPSDDDDDARNMIIGVGGPTRAGKTSTAAWYADLCRERGYTVRVISQDDYSRKRLAPVLPDGRRNYEVPQATDWRSFHRAVAAARRTCQITIVEGFLLFHDPPASFDLGVFIEISQDESRRRRCVEARGHKQSPQFFDAYTWPSYLRFGTARPSTTLTVDATGLRRDELQAHVENLLKVHLMASPLTPARAAPAPPPPAAAAPPAAVALPPAGGGADERRVVLAMHGSFNPVHRGHIAAMEAAKAALEAQGYVVPYGELAITKQSHVTGKGVPCLKDRLRLLEIGCAATPWLHAADGSQATTGTKHVAKGVRRLQAAAGGGFTAAVLDGGDVCLRWPKPNKPPAKLATGAGGAQRNALRFVVLRADDDAAKVRRAAPYHAVLLPPPADGALAAASSTAARAALDRRDHAELAAICGDAVAAALRERLQAHGTVVQGSFSSAALYHAAPARVSLGSRKRAAAEREEPGTLRGVGKRENGRAKCCNALGGCNQKLETGTVVLVAASKVFQGHQNDGYMHPACWVERCNGGAPLPPAELRALDGCDELAADEQRALLAATTRAPVVVD